MNHSSKKLKTFSIFISLVTYFSLIDVPRAYAAFDLAGCISTAVITPLAVNAATLALQALITAAGFTAATTAATTAAVVAVPTSDIVASGILGSISGNTNAHSTFQDSFKMDLDAMAYGVGQCTLQMLTENTVEWIKGGFNGSPNFAVNPSQLFQDIANNVTDDFSNEILQGIETCNFSPNFNSDLANSVLLSTRSGASGKFRASVKCNFPSNINPSEFYDDFSKGGWGGFEASLSDRGNTFGVKLATSRELATRQEAAQAKQDQKLAHSNGFLDIVDESDCPDMPDRVTYGIIQGDITGKEKKAYQQEYCNTITPGKMVSDQLTKSLGTDMDRLGFADNLNKIISALIGQLTRSAITGIFK